MEPVWVAAGSFILAVVVQIVIAVWILRGMESSLISRIQLAKEEVERQIQQVKENASAALVAAIQARNLEMDIIKNASGEIGHSLREKIAQVELFMRDEFLRIKDFEMHINLIRDQLNAYNARMDTRFDRFESKLDELTRRDV